MTSTDASFQVRDEECAFYEHELASFIPDRLFDAHTQLCSRIIARCSGRRTRK